MSKTKEKRDISKLNNVFDWLVDSMGKFASYLILLISVMVTLDIAARYLLGASSEWTIEFTAYFMVALIFFGLPYTTKEEANIKIDIIFSRLPEKIQKILTLLSSIVFMFFAALLGYLSWDSVVTSFVFHTTSRTSIDVIIWPFQLPIPLGLSILTLFIIRDICRQINKFN